MKRYYQQGLLQRYFPELEDNETAPQGWYDVTNIANLEQMSFEEIERALGIYVEPTFDLENAKQDKLKELNAYVDAKFKAYLAKYPEVEVQSFMKKSEEALKVRANTNLALTETPYLTELTGNTTIEARNALATAVYAKIYENAQLEAFAVNKRDAITAASNQSELDAITWR